MSSRQRSYRTVEKGQKRAPKPGDTVGRRQRVDETVEGGVQESPMPKSDLTPNAIEGVHPWNNVD